MEDLRYYIGNRNGQQAQVFSSRAILTLAVDGGYRGQAGKIVIADGLAYKWEDGATVIPDLPGLVPVEPVQVEHWGAANIASYNAAIRAGYQVTIPKGDYSLAGQALANDNAGIEGTADGWMFQTDFSSNGSFVTNADDDSSDAGSIMENWRTVGLNISGSTYPAPLEFQVEAGGTTTTFVLPASASPVDDFYTGLAVQFNNGPAAQGKLFLINNYVGSTRTATVHTPFAGAPVAGNTVLIGYNDNAQGYAFGAKHLKDFGGISRDYTSLTQVPNISGGKGVNYEQGVTDAITWGRTFKNKTMAVFVQGLDGTWGNGSKKRTVGIRAGGYYAENCGSVITIGGVNTAQLPDGDADDQMVMFGFIQYENCGFAPYRIVNTDQQKSGIINLMEAQNFVISDVQGRNDTTYPHSSPWPGWPTDFNSRVGSAYHAVNNPNGVEGNVGALIWGHGRNGVVSNVQHHGDLDTVVHIGRARAMGDDAGGGVGNCYNLRFLDLQVHGDVETIIRLDINPTHRVPAAQLTGELRVVVDSCTAIVESTMAAFNNFIVDVTERGTGKRIIGTPAQIYAGGNTFASFATVDSLIVDLRQTNQVRQLANSGAKISNTGSTTENTLVTKTLPANSLGPNGFIRVWTTWTVTGSVNNKTLRVRLGGTTFLAVVVTGGTTVSAQCFTLIRNRNATNSQVGNTTAGITGGSTSVTATGAIDTTADQNITITAQCANSGDTIDLEGYTIEVCYAP